ncbi:polysaccharide biosynthesis C-terminal domain-containing protein, partial [Acinetobacter soli]|uniref:polysaccharide biosynthesis C-terminal domain-containing protein n=1 Tax=Acinetobacter soli TaxID=487316 RepID=UPI0028136036
MNEYIGWNHRMLGSYRAVMGHFEEDQWFMVASAASNVILSFALVIPFGLAGVVAATVFAHCLMWIGRARVVCRHYMK